MSRESLLATMEMVDAMVVQGELIFAAVDAELPGADPVAVTADGVAHGAMGLQIGIEAVKPQGHIIHVAAGIGDDDALKDGAPFDHGDGGAHGVGQGKAADILAFGGFAPDFGFDGHVWNLLSMIDV